MFALTRLRKRVGAGESAGDVHVDLRQHIEAAQQDCEEHLRNPTAPWQVPASEAVHDWAKGARPTWVTFRGCFYR
jgi:hypothetical protein